MQFVVLNLVPRSLTRTFEVSIIEFPEETVNDLILMHLPKSDRGIPAKILLSRIDWIVSSLGMRFLFLCLDGSICQSLSLGLFCLRISIAALHVGFGDDRVHDLVFVQFILMFCPKMLTSFDPAFPSQPSQYEAVGGDFTAFSVICHRLKKTKYSKSQLILR
jgi:hypothetical protein